MPKKDDVLVAAKFAAIAGLVFAYFSLKIVTIPSELTVLGYAFAWILGFILVFLFVIYIGRDTVDKDLRGIEANIEDIMVDLPRSYEQARQRIDQSVFGSKRKSILFAAMLYVVVGALACWAPPYFLLFVHGDTDPNYHASFEDQLTIMAAGAFLAILFGLPLTYFKGKHYLRLGVFLIGTALFLVSCTLAMIAGI